jgi:hypothetical protein
VSLSLFYSSTQDFAILNVIHSRAGIITAPAVYIQMPFMFTRLFIPYVIKWFFILPTFFFCIRKMASKIFTKYIKRS